MSSEDSEFGGSQNPSDEMVVVKKDDSPEVSFHSEEFWKEDTSDVAKFEENSKYKANSIQFTVCSLSLLCL